MSNTPQPIQFLLHQLATNEGDRGRFNNISEIKIEKDYPLKEGGSIFTFQNNYFGSYDFNLDQDLIPDLMVEKIIRTCLSRVTTGNSILKIFETKNFDREPLIDELYESFDIPIYQGEPLDQAIQALHEKMFELVPKYREFLNNLNN